MKNVFLIIVSLFAATQVVTAQKASVGISGGMNFSNINGVYNSDGYQTQSSKLITKQFGVLLEYSLSESISLFSDPGYYERGFKYGTDNEMVGGTSVKGQTKIKSIDVPLTVKFGMFKNQLFYVRAGVYMSFLLSAQNNDTIYYYDPDSGIGITENDISDKMNKTVFGFVAGAGFDIPVSQNIGVLFDVAYRLDLTDAMLNHQTSVWPWKSSGNYYVNAMDVRNRSLSLSVGVRYRFGD